MASFDEDMHRLSEGIKTLQVAYSRYFTGALDRPPVELQASLAGVIREHTVSTDGQRTAERFRFNSLVSRYHIMIEMWNRNVRQIEEGRPSALDRRGPKVEARSRASDDATQGARFQNGQSTPEDPQMQKLYKSYLSAARTGGATKQTLSYRNFFSQINRRLEKCQKKNDCQEVLFRVVLVDNRPVLKVKYTS